MFYYKSKGSNNQKPGERNRVIHVRERVLKFQMEKEQSMVVVGVNLVLHPSWSPKEVS